MMAAISQRALAYSSSAICRVFVFSLPVVSLDVEGLACVRKRCGGCVLGCAAQARGELAACNTLASKSGIFLSQLALRTCA